MAALLARKKRRTLHASELRKSDATERVANTSAALIASQRAVAVERTHIADGAARTKALRERARLLAALASRTASAATARSSFAIALSPAARCIDLGPRGFDLLAERAAKAFTVELWVQPAALHGAENRAAFVSTATRSIRMQSKGGSNSSRNADRGWFIGIDRGRIAFGVAAAVPNDRAASSSTTSTKEPLMMHVLHGPRVVKERKSKGGFAMTRGESDEVVAGQWLHLAGTFDGASLRLVVNGSVAQWSGLRNSDAVSAAATRGGSDEALVVAPPSCASAAANASLLLLGYSLASAAGTACTNATIDNVAIWSRALPLAELRQHALSASRVQMLPGAAPRCPGAAFLAPRSVRAPGLLMHYEFGAAPAGPCVHGGVVGEGGGPSSPKKKTRPVLPGSAVVRDSCEQHIDGIARRRTTSVGGRVGPARSATTLESTLVVWTPQAA